MGSYIQRGGELVCKGGVRALRGIGILAGAAILGVGAVVMDKFGNPLTESDEEEPETDDVPFDEGSEAEAA